MRKLIVTEWLTLDGVFDADNMAEWHTPYNTASRQESISDTINGCGALLYGRITYQMLYPYWSQFKHNENNVADTLNNAPKYVVSSTLKDAPWHNSTILSGNITDEIRKLKQQAGNYILIEGSGTLVQSLMGTDLIDEYRFLVHPVIMSSGKKFFQDGMDFAKLELTESKPLEKGVMSLTYQTAKK